MPTGASGIAAATATITQQAIQQTRQTDMDGIDTRRLLAAMVNNRNRLIGPPPAFELNVLQHLQETRGKPEGADPTDSGRVTDLPESLAAAAEPEPVPTAGYEALSESGPREYQTRIDKHL